MNQRLMTNQQKRVVAAMAIEQRLDTLAEDSGMTVMSMAWDLKRNEEDATLHCLDVWIDDYNARMFFTDNEMFAFIDDASEDELDVRLRCVVHEVQDLKLARGGPKLDAALLPQHLH